MKRIAFAAVAAVFLVGCSAKEPVSGIWKGKINVPDQMKNDPMAKAQIAQIGSPILDLKGDNTFSLTMGLPIAGTWTEGEKELTLKATKINGQPLSSLPPQAAEQVKNLEAIKVTISEDRRKLTMQASPGMSGSIEFTR